VGALTDRWPANDKGGCSYTLSEDGTVTSISLYVASYSATCNIKIGIYAADGTGGAAGALRGQTASHTITQTGWHTWSNLNFPLTAGKYYLYWVCSNTFTSRATGQGDSQFTTKINYAQEFLSTCQKMTTDAGYGGQSIYANYTTAASPTATLTPTATPTPTVTPTPSPSPTPVITTPPLLPFARPRSARITIKATWRMK
jgi:hypothetical protein